MTGASREDGLANRAMYATRKLVTGHSEWESKGGGGLRIAIVLERLLVNHYAP